jgi:cobalamin biosynthesis protein CobD/CbiB
MSVMAGALGVELKKVGYYCLGAGHALPAAQDIPAAIRLLAWTVAMAVSLLAIVQVLLLLL